MHLRAKSYRVFFRDVVVPGAIIALAGLKGDMEYRMVLRMLEMQMDHGNAVQKFRWSNITVLCGSIMLVTN